MRVEKWRTKLSPKHSDDGPNTMAAATLFIPTTGRFGYLKKITHKSILCPALQQSDIRVVNK